MFKRLTLAASLLLACFPLAVAASSTERPAKPAQRERSSRPGQAARVRPTSLHVPLWIGNGPAAPQPPDAFKASLNGTPSRVVGFRGAQEPLLLFVAIDFSADLILTESAKAALLDAVQQAPPNVYFSLLRIPEQPMVLVDPGKDYDGFAQALRALPMSGRAGFFEMVDVVASVTNPIVVRNPVRAAVLYLTDSEIRNYRQDYTNPVINSADSRDLSRRFPDALIREKVSTLTNELLRTAVPIFVVHLNYRRDPLNEAYQTGIKRLSEATGGRSVFCRSIAEIPVAIGDMVNAIQAMGMVEVDIPDGLSGSTTLSLEHGDGALEFRSLFDIPK